MARGGKRLGAGRPTVLDPNTVVGGFVIRNGLSRQSAGTILGYSASAISKWGRGHAPAPLAVRLLIVALECLAAANLPWPGELQPDRRPEPRFPLMYPTGRVAGYAPGPRNGLGL